MIHYQQQRMIYSTKSLSIDTNPTSYKIQFIAHQLPLPPPPPPLPTPTHTHTSCQVRLEPFDAPYATTYDCPLSGNVSITIEGINFGSNPRVFIADIECFVSVLNSAGDSGSLDQLVCLLPGGTTERTSLILDLRLTYFTHFTPPFIIVGFSDNSIEPTEYTTLETQTRYHLFNLCTLQSPTLSSSSSYHSTPTIELPSLSLTIPPFP